MLAWRKRRAAPPISRRRRSFRRSPQRAKGTTSARVTRPTNPRPSRGSWSRTRRSDGQLEVVDDHRSQDHRPVLYRDLGHHDGDRWCVGRDHSRPTHFVQQQLGLARPVQRTLHHARLSDDLPLRRALRLRRTGQYPRAHSNRCAGHGLSPTECAELLAVPDGLDHHVDGFLHRRGRGQFWLGRLRAAVELDQHPRRRCGPVDRRATPYRILGDLHRGESDRDDFLLARAGHDDVSNADLHVEHVGYRDLDPAGIPGTDRRTDHALLRSTLRYPYLLGPRRWSARALAAHFLVLGPSGGLYLGPAVLWHGDRDHPGLLA